MRCPDKGMYLMTKAVKRIILIIRRNLEISILAGALSLMLALPSLGSAYPGPPPRGYDRLRDAVYGQNMPIETIKNLYSINQATIRASSTLKDQERYYWLSMSEYLIGRAYSDEKDKKSAARHLNIALDYVEESLVRREYSEGYRIMSDIIGHLCLVKSFGYLLRHGPKVKRFANKALELDPLNGKAQIILASSRIYPPIAFGGDPETGIERMKKALAMPDIARDDLFNIYLGIGVGYTKLNEPQEASIWIKKALEVYPGNKYALEVSLKLR